MKIWKIISAIVLSGGICSTVAAAEDSGTMVVNGESQIKLGENTHKSRVSAAIKINAEELARGVVTLQHFNLLLFDVAQSDITHREAIGNEKGTLGFMNEDASQITYDAKSKTLSGKITGSVNIPGYIDPNPRPIDENKKEDAHLFPAATQTAVIDIRLKLGEDLSQYVGVDKEMHFNGELDISAKVLANKTLKIRDYNFEVIGGIIDIGIAWRFELAKRLCVQPVRIMSFDVNPWVGITLKYTGDGYPFGKPGAITEWNKADLVFSWNSWHTVLAPNLWTFESTEAATLRATHDNPDCVEVFFVDNFNPMGFWGGGASFDSGTSAAQIISTDENADFGVDLTHLAHELGHSVSLCHPSDAFCEARPEMNPASEGTLMCPSGFANDNPQVNSVENENSVNNPLLTFSLKPVTAGADCTDDSDCGLCI